jgi:hypothetical protein
MTQTHTKMGCHSSWSSESHPKHPLCAREYFASHGYWLYTDDQFKKWLGPGVVASICVFTSSTQYLGNLSSYLAYVLIEVTSNKF